MSPAASTTRHPTRSAELVGDGERVRLIGVRAEHLRASGNGAMLWDPDEEWRDAERTIDEVHRANSAREPCGRPPSSNRAGGRRGDRPRADPDDDDVAAEAAGCEVVARGIRE